MHIYIHIHIYTYIHIYMYIDSNKTTLSTSYMWHLDKVFQVKHVV